jgi:hypothetical protein
MSEPVKTCKGIVQSGPRKGQYCIPMHAVDADGYCSTHQRSKEYDKIIQSNKFVCRNFFRGCNSITTVANKACSECLAKNRKNKEFCNHTGCTHEIEEAGSKYCGKHRRDKYYDLEREKNIKLCNIERGCFNECDPGFLSCKTCISYKFNLCDRYFNPLMELPKRLCIHCESPFESSEYLDRTMSCSDCFTKYLDLNKTCQIYSDSLRREGSTITVIENEYKKGAASRGLQFSLDTYEIQELISLPCHYCGISSHTTNGIDRVDNSKGYIRENCVSCCTVCNRMKHTMTKDSFLERCRMIDSYLNNGIVINMGEHTLARLRSYNEYKSRSETRNIVFNLSEEEFNSIRTDSCYMCGVKNCCGVDRVNNLDIYTCDNCMPCCSICNNLKADIPIGIIRYTIKNICSKINTCLTPTDKVCVRPMKHSETPEIPTPPTSNFTAPKQWKVKNIYEAIVGNAGHLYKSHCEQNNDIPDSDDWERRWNDLIVSVQSIPLKDSEAIIRKFVEWLRTLRHNKLVADKNINSNSRQVWTATYVKYLYDNGRIGEFKTHTEAFAGDSDADPNWVRRWNKFLETLGEFGGDSENAVKYISKFMANQRTYKCNRTKAATPKAPPRTPT